MTINIFGVWMLTITLGVAFTAVLFMTLIMVLACAIGYVIWKESE